MKKYIFCNDLNIKRAQKDIKSLLDKGFDLSQVINLMKDHNLVVMEKQKFIGFRTHDKAN